MAGGLYSIFSATLRIVTACHPSLAAIARAESRMDRRISSRSRSRRSLTPIPLPPTSVRRLPHPGLEPPEGGNLGLSFALFRLGAPGGGNLCLSVLPHSG